MRGLMEKDLAIIKQRGKILGFLVVWGIIMNFIMEDASFVVGWLVMITVITSMSTISYDEYDNGMPFLMSLPVSRRDYAVEKYLFSLLCGVVSWIVALLIVACTSPFTGTPFRLTEDLPGMVTFLAVTLIVLAVTIPPQLKWGAEKGRIVMLIIFGVGFVAVFLIGKLGGDLQKTVAWLETLSMPAFVAAFFAVSLILVAISIGISIRIMEGKEF